MIEDKLTHDERRRLEAVGQAVALFAMGGRASIDVVLSHAKAIEKYVATGET